MAGGLLWTSGGVYRLPDRELISKYYAVCPACGGYRESDEPLDPICPSCDVQQTGTPRRYCVPEFGFVAQRDTKRPGMSPPRRSWNGTTYVLSLATEVEEATWQLANGGTVTTRAGSRGQLIAVSEGPNRGGYLICDWCGWGTPVRPKVPGKHPHLLRDRDCTGPLQLRALAHRYETDIVAISFDALAAPFAVNGPLEVNPLCLARRSIRAAADQPRRHRRHSLPDARRPDLAGDLRRGARRSRQRNPHCPFVRRGAGGSANPGQQM